MYVNSYILISAAGLSVFRPQRNGNKLTVFSAMLPVDFLSCHGKSGITCQIRVHAGR